MPIAPPQLQQKGLQASPNVPSEAKSLQLRATESDLKKTNFRTEEYFIITELILKKVNKIYFTEVNVPKWGNFKDINIPS